MVGITSYNTCSSSHNSLLFFLAIWQNQRKRKKNKEIRGQQQQRGQQWRLLLLTFLLTSLKTVFVRCVDSANLQLTFSNWKYWCLKIILLLLFFIFRTLKFFSGEGSLWGLWLCGVRSVDVSASFNSARPMSGPWWGKKSSVCAGTGPGHLFLVSHHSLGSVETRNIRRVVQGIWWRWLERGPASDLENWWPKFLGPPHLSCWCRHLLEKNKANIQGNFRKADA